MDKRYFIKKNQFITGPFSKSDIISMLESGQVQVSDMVSGDKSSWEYIQQALDLPLPKAENLDRMNPSESVAFMLPPNDMPEPPESKPLPPPAIKKPVLHCKTGSNEDNSGDNSGNEFSLNRIFSLTLGALFNGCNSLKLLAAQAVYKIIAASVSAFFTSLLLNAICCAAFIQYYNVSLYAALLRFGVFIVLAGVVLYLINLFSTLWQCTEYTPEKRALDLLSAMLTLQSISAVTALLTAVMFYGNGELFNVGSVKMQIISCVFLLPAGFFTANALVTGRLHFLASHKSGLFTANLLAVAGLYFSVILALLLIYPIYTA
ncbi:MAG: hypothetical protein J6S19_02780 [Lentisphaeria bacterium]|nr:hypothetical protein [Lentisphaeria bacterium]